MKEAPTNGREWIVEAFGCAPELLRDEAALRAHCDRIVETLDLHVVGAPQWHTFPGHAGVTGLYLLSESHLAVHTYPEYGALTLNLYTCRDRGDDVEAVLRKGLAKVNVRTLARTLKP